MRLDLIQHPYGPCSTALEASEGWRDTPIESLAATLRQRLGEVHRTAADSIVLLNGVDDALERMVRGATGPIIGFPPSACASTIARSPYASRAVWIARGWGSDSGIELDPVTDIPPHSIAIIDSPSDPLGSLLAAADAVRLARACRVLVIDERYAEFAGFTLLPLGLEFDNIVVLRSFETWAGIQDPPCAWAAASRRAAKLIGVEAVALAPEAIAGALATLESMDSVGVTLKLVREERSRLYRFLRKFSFVEPIPSWGPFLAARVNIVSREAVVSGLAYRGIHIHAPSQPGLERFVRIGIGSRSMMDRLRSALLELAPELVS